MSRTYYTRRERERTQFEREADLLGTVDGIGVGSSGHQFRPKLNTANTTPQRYRQHERDVSPPASASFGYEPRSPRSPPDYYYAHSAFSGFEAGDRDRGDRGDRVGSGGGHGSSARPPPVPAAAAPLRSPSYAGSEQYQRTPRDRADVTRQRRDMRLERARNRMRHEAYRYPRPLQEYLEPVIQSAQAMEHAAEAFMKLDEDARFLARSSAAFLRSLGAGPDERIPDPDDGSDSEVTTDAESKWDTSGYGDSDETGSGNGNGDNNRDGSDDGDEDDDDDVYGSSASSYRRPGRGPDGDTGNTGKEVRRITAEPPGFMQWSGWTPHPLSKAPDVVGDRRKSFLALAQTVSAGHHQHGLPPSTAAAAAAATVSTKGFFGVMARVLQPKDYRAYFKASARIILLPDTIARRPDELELEAYERSLLGTGKFIGSGSMMACLTYSDHDFGTITLFRLEMGPSSREGGGGSGGSDWPRRIRPVAAMTDVPRKLLEKTAKSVPRTNRTVLQVKSNSLQQPLRWVSYPSAAVPGLGYSPNVGRSGMSAAMLEPLGIECEELKIAPGTTANIVCAPVPAMMAWLHVRASTVAGIELEGTEVQRGSSSSTTTTAAAAAADEGGNTNGSSGRAKVRRIVRWKKGPAAKEHQGRDPCIVVLHPSRGEWVTAPVYWTEVKE